MTIDLEEFQPPERPDFRRVGKGTPYVMNVEGTKRERYSRSSNAGKILDDESNLTDWKLRTVIAGAAQRPELMALAATYDVDLNKGELRDIVEKCIESGRGERRAIIGTAIHAMFDHLDRGDDWLPPPQFAALCAAYQQWLIEWGLEPREIEIKCINDEFRLAGTLDRRYRTTKAMVAPDGTIIPIGSYIVGDIKTGRELEYAAGSYSTQIAAYVDSMRYDVATDTRSAFDPESVKDWALVIHAEAMESIEVYWVDLEAGRAGLALADQVRHWRRRDDLLIIGTKTPVALAAAPADALNAAEPSPLPAESHVEPRDGLGLREYLRERVRAVLGHSELAGKSLQRQWPNGVPGLKNDSHSVDQLEQIQTVLTKVEGEFNLGRNPDWRDPIEHDELAKARMDRLIGVSKARHPSNQQLMSEAHAVQRRIDDHPRRGLLRRWISLAIDGGVNHSLDTSALVEVLMTFAGVSETEWSDDDITVMLDGSMRALGYIKGCGDLGRFDPAHAPMLSTAAFAVIAGNATLMFDEGDNPIVRTNVVKG